MSLSSHNLYKVTGGISNLGSLADLGITAAKVTQQSQGDYTMELTVPRGVDGTLLFTPFSRYDLVDVTGAVRFAGWLLEPPRKATPTSEFHVYKFTGPWGFYLDKTIYKNANQIAIDPTDPASDTVATFMSVIFSNILNGDRVSIKTQVEDALKWAQAHAMGIAPETGDFPTLTTPPFLYDTSELVGLIPTEEAQKNITCAEMIRTQLRWTPKTSCYWTFGEIGAEPMLVFVASYADDPKTLTYPVYNGGSVTAFDGTPRYDMLLSKVKIYYLAELLATDAATLWRSFGSDTSTAANGSPFTLELTADLTPYEFTIGPFHGGATQPTGIAAEIHEPFKTLSYDMAWTRQLQEVDWADRPAEKWNVAGAGAGFDSAAGVAQQIVRDLANGTVSYKIGFPNHLSLDDLLKLIRSLRRVMKGKGSNSPNKESTGKGGGDGGGGGGGGGTFDLSVEADGGGGATGVNDIVFTAVDPGAVTAITADGSATATVKFPTETVTGAVNGAPKIRDFLVRGPDWSDP